MRCCQPDLYRYPTIHGWNLYLHNSTAIWNVDLEYCIANGCGDRKRDGLLKAGLHSDRLTDSGPNERIIHTCSELHQQPNFLCVDWWCRLYTSFDRLKLHSETNRNYNLFCRCHGRLWRGCV